MSFDVLYNSGKSFFDFINDGDKVIKDHMGNKYRLINLDNDLSKINKKYIVEKILAFAENWCPDCQVSLPIMAKLCDLAGIGLKILNREGHEDDLLKYSHDEPRIPTYVFVDKDYNVIDIWIERPKVIKKLAEKDDFSWRFDYIKGKYDKEIIKEFLKIISR